MSDTAPSPNGRYEISILDGRYGLFAVRIFDVEQQRNLVTWQGDAARYLLATGAVPVGNGASFRAG